MSGQDRGVWCVSLLYSVSDYDEAASSPRLKIPLGHSSKEQREWSTKHIHGYAPEKRGVTGVSVSRRKRKTDDIN